MRENVSMLGLGLENNLDRPMSSLSGGQRQALTLVMAIMCEAKIILLDEPSSALDPKTASLVMQAAEKIISEFNLTAILVTHNIKEAKSHGSRIVQMDEGTIIRDLRGKNKTSLQPSEILEWFG